MYFITKSVKFCYINREEHSIIISERLHLEKNENRCRDAQTNIRLCFGNQAEDGEDGLWKPVGVKDATRTLSTESNNLGLQWLTETKPPSVRLYGSYLVLCMYVLVVYLPFLVELLTVVVGIVSDSFACFMGPILSTGLLYPAII